MNEIERSNTRLIDQQSSPEQIKRRIEAQLTECNAATMVRIGAWGNMNTATILSVASHIEAMTCDVISDH
jgi:hypothetical protein